jgi:hypothetical protein
MPGPLLHVGATVLCAHGGQAQPTTPNPRVIVSGTPTVTMTAPYVVAGCPFAPGGVPSPCVTATWTSAATRVFSNGQPLVLLDSQALTVPNAVPLIATATQTRVVGA